MFLGKVRETVHRMLLVSSGSRDWRHHLHHELELHSIVVETHGRSRRGCSRDFVSHQPIGLIGYQPCSNFCPELYLVCELSLVQPFSEALPL